ncbi:hypothetical protein FB451DRAFT_1565594 [Mycena latifolia]|nr:hypothetical protein FB451DRAFT_1565594 [Mycena latifolia]
MHHYQARQPPGRLVRTRRSITKRSYSAHHIHLQRPPHPLAREREHAADGYRRDADRLLGERGHAAVALEDADEDARPSNFIKRLSWSSTMHSCAHHSRSPAPTSAAQGELPRLRKTRMRTRCPPARGVLRIPPPPCAPAPTTAALPQPQAPHRGAAVALEDASASRAPRAPRPSCAEHVHSRSPAPTSAAQGKLPWRWKKRTRTRWSPASLLCVSRVACAQHTHTRP